MKKNGGNGKRKHPRVEIVLKVEYPAAADFFADYTHDMSGGGVFVATTKDFSVGEQLTFDISFPGLLSPIRCRGEVRWSRSLEEETDDQPAGIGIAFIFPSKKESEEIRRLLEGLNQRPAQAGQRAEPFRVLIAEDSPIIRDMFRLAVIEYHQSKFSSLRKLDVVEAANGEEAWKHLQEGTFDLAIVDYYMPVMNGGELVRKIRNDESHRSLTIIVVSVGGEDVQREVYSAGADLFLKKPVLLKQLLESLESLLGLKREGYDQD